MFYIDGASIDYVDNLMGGGFHIDNPAGRQLLRLWQQLPHGQEPQRRRNAEELRHH